MMKEKDHLACAQFSSSGTFSCSRGLHPHRVMTWSGGSIFFFQASVCVCMQHSEKRKSFPENSLIIIARQNAAFSWCFFARWAS